nr:farnesyl diphosphate synthase [Thiomicrorhabdus aquaedulcis]
MHTNLKLYQDRVNKALLTHLTFQQTQQPDTPNTLFLALHYATLNPGKRLRPALVYAMGEALNIPLEQLDSAACAIELIHSYSLVHDDLPAMDNDSLRRGLPTCHIHFNEAMAILAGDAQQTLAFYLLSHDTHVSDRHKITLIQLLSKASGTAGMIGGQVIDIESENKTLTVAQLQTLHQLKTGALLKTALLMGACQSPQYSELTEAIERFGELIGLAFQVHDDILDIEGDTQTLGKPQGSDERAQKSTYPRLMGLEASKNHRDTLISHALQTLERLPIDSSFLQQLTLYIAQRKH